MPNPYITPQTFAFLRELAAHNQREWFNQDKSVYKTYAALSFRHIDGKDVAAPGFYVHVEPGRVFLGAGKDALVRAPRGYDPEHPFAEDLMRKSFISTARLSQAQACAGDFLTRLERECRKRVPLMEFPGHALGVAW